MTYNNFHVIYVIYNNEVEQEIHIHHSYSKHNVHMEYAVSS